MPKCRNCERILIEDATFCPGCSLENPLDSLKKKKKISFNSFSFFSTALFWLWAVPLWIVLWFIWVCLSVLEYYVFWLFSRTVSEFVPISQNI